MATYTKATNFAVKDGLPSGNPSKIVKGTEIDIEFNSIQTAVNANDTATTSALSGKQPLDATLTSIALLGTATDKIAYTTGVDTWAETPLTAAARTVLDDVTVADIRTTLGAAASGTLTSSGITGAAASGANTDITSLASPALANATANTQTVGDNSTKVATTAFVTTASSASGTSKIQSVTATQGSGALTFGLATTLLDFRSTTLTTGVPTTIASGALSLVLPSGGTLGAVTTVTARVVLVAINNAGTVELAVVNLAGGNDLSETGVINTTAISASSTAANVFYSTTARTGVAYRVVGSVDAVNTAGAWGNPTLVQGIGGQALAAMSSLGYGQTWQDVTGSRASGTTYYNTTGRPIFVSVSLAFGGGSGVGFTVNGTGAGLLGFQNISANGSPASSLIVPSGASYSATITGTVQKWYELR